MFERKHISMSQFLSSRSGLPLSRRAGQISFEAIVMACVIFLLGTVLLIGVDLPLRTQASKSEEPAQEVREFAKIDSPAGSLAVRYDNRCVIWNPQMDMAEPLWLPPSSHRLTAMASSPSAPYLVVGWADGVLSQIDSESQRPRWEATLHDGEPTLLEYSHDGSMILVGSSNGQIVLLENEEGATRWTRHPIASPQMAMSFSTDDQLVLVAHETSVAILDSQTGDRVDQIQNLSGRPSSIRMSSDGQYLAVSTFEGFLDLYNFSTRKKLFSTQFSKLAILSLVFSPDQTRLYFSTQDGRVALVDLQNDFSIKEFGGHQMTVATMTLFDDDLITGSFDGEIRVWPRIHEDNPGEMTRTFERSIALSPEGFNSQ